MSLRHLVALLGAAAALSAASPAHTDAPLAAASTSVFTVAGGGSTAPADGVVATVARLHLYDVAGLARGGALLITDEHAAAPGAVRLPLWRLDPSGVLRSVPGLPEAALVAAAPDGHAAYAVPVVRHGAGSTTVLRVDPLGLAAPQPVADLAGRLKQISALVALDDGSLVVSDGHTTLRIAPDGGVAPVGPRRRHDDVLQALVAQPRGAVLEIGSGGNALRVAADGTATVLPRLGTVAAFAALGDGTVVVGRPARGTSPTIEEAKLTGIALLDPTGTAPARTLVSGVPGLGDGDGGRPARLRLALGDAATTPEGGLVVDDVGDAGDRLRLLSPFGTTPPAAVAIAPATFAGVRHGRLSFLTGQGGTVTLTAVRAGHARITATARAPGGLGELLLPRPLPRGGWDLRLAFTGDDGSRGIARLHVEPATVLTLGRARSLVGGRLVERGGGDPGEGDDFGPGRCSRSSPRTVSCQVIEHAYGPSGDFRGCVGRVFVALRPDGLRERERRGC